MPKFQHTLEGLSGPYLTFQRFQQSGALYKAIVFDKLSTFDISPVQRAFYKEELRALLCKYPKTAGRRLISVFANRNPRAEAETEQVEAAEETAEVAE